MSLIHKIATKLVTWALYPEKAPFAARGTNVWFVNPYMVNCPDRVFLGNDIYIGPHAVFNSIGGVRIHDGCAFGPFLHIYSANHRYEDAEALPYDEWVYVKPVEILPNVWIGGDVAIMPGVTVGEGAVVAGGSLLVKDVPPGAVVGGAPAKVIKYRDMKRYEQLKREGKILNAMHGAGRNRVLPIGGIPARWYRDARLPVPAEAIEDAPPGHPKEGTH